MTCRHRRNRLAAPDPPAACLLFLERRAMVTVVMPARNEADVIESSVREWHHEVIAKIPGSRMIVVDDASTDTTGSILARLADELPELLVIRPPRRRGHGPSVCAGLRRADTEYVFHTDSDRQHVPSEFWMLWAERETADFVMGVRRKRADGRLRSGISAAMRIANAVVWQKWIRDANCPFKLMRRAALVEVLARIPDGFFIPMVAVSLLARKMGFGVKEIPVTHMPRQTGTPSLRGPATWLWLAPRCVWEMVRLRCSRMRPEK